MLSRILDQTLHRALALASERKHLYATIEHLLLALTDDADAAAVLRASRVDLDKLRVDVALFLDKELEGLVTDRRGDPQPTAGFQRVVQRAAIQVQSAGRAEVTGANALVSLLDERESLAVYFLQSQDMTRLDALNFVSHGLARVPGAGEAAPPVAVEGWHATTHKVLILNDDYTPMAFALDVLERFFDKPREDALRLMLDVHRHGSGVCGLYSRDGARAKLADVMAFAREHGHPLQCTIEQA